MAKIPSSGGGSKFEYSVIDNDTYEARLVRLIFVGVQPQRPFKGQAKPDALQAKLAFELIGETITVTNTEDGSKETRPAMVFNDIIIPGGGTTRGKAFDLIQACVGAEACFDDTEDYRQLLNCGVSVTVGSYVGQKTGKLTNCVDAVGALGKKAKERLEDSTVDNIFFDCYADDAGSKEVFATLGKFIQDKIKEAKDAQYIPAITQEWPTEKPSDDSDDKDEF